MFQESAATAAAAEEANRKLKAGGSHAEAPERQSQKLTEAADVPVEDDDVDAFDDKDVKGMFKFLVKEMRKSSVAAESASVIATEANKVAMAAKAAVEVVSADIEQIKGDVREVLVMKEKMITKDELPKLVKAITFDPWASAAESKQPGKGGDAGSVKAHGKAGGKGWKSVEEKSRTLYFGKFPETKEAIIVQHIEQWTKNVQQDIEETYAFGKISERGATRFKSEESMWEFLANNKGKLQYDAMGTKVYANPDSTHDPNPDKSKAIRKVVRMIIEANGGDGQVVKKDIITNYGSGKVWWKDVKVAEWDNATMKIKLLGAAAEYQQQFNKLMGIE